MRVGGSLLAVAAVGLVVGGCGDVGGGLGPLVDLGGEQPAPRASLARVAGGAPATSPPPTGSGGGPVTPPPPVPGSVTVNVGINRDIVPDYPGDACGSVADLVVIDTVAPGGARLDHVELDCGAGGYNGWTYFDQAEGTYMATLQLFNVDEYGVRTPVTEPRIARGDLRPGEGVVIWVDYTYRDFAVEVTGNLKWRVGWASTTEPDVQLGCEQAQPQVASQRITVRDDQGRLVDSWASGPAGFVRTDGSAAGPCSDFGPSDAQVVTALPWGIYSVTVEGLDAAGAVAYCSRRDLFSPKGDGVIFQLTAATGPCAAGGE